jgi:hypothetical protein
MKQPAPRSRANGIVPKVNRKDLMKNKASRGLASLIISEVQISKKRLGAVILRVYRRLSIEKFAGKSTGKYHQIYRLGLHWIVSKSRKLPCR